MDATGPQRCTDGGQPSLYDRSWQLLSDCRISVSLRQYPGNGNYTRALGDHAGR